MAHLHWRYCHYRRHCRGPLATRRNQRLRLGNRNLRHSRRQRPHMVWTHHPVDPHSPEDQCHRGRHPPHHRTRFSYRPTTVRRDHRHHDWNHGLNPRDSNRQRRTGSISDQRNHQQRHVDGNVLHHCRHCLHRCPADKPIQPDCPTRPHACRLWRHDGDRRSSRTPILPIFPSIKPAAISHHHLICALEGNQALLCP